MAHPAAATVISHWCKLFESFEASPLVFYPMIEDAVKRREIPNIEVSRVDWNEGGISSAKREYLRISRGRQVFDICGAPFGTGFFVSSWLARPESAPWPVAVFLLFLSGFVCFGIFTAVLGFFMGIPAFVVGYPLLFWVFSQVMNQQSDGWDDSLVAIPFLGPIYERLFRPLTYYKIDTTLMFREAVHGALLEAVDQLTAAKGMRALTELERKPTLKSFATGAGE